MRGVATGHISLSAQWRAATCGIGQPTIIIVNLEQVYGVYCNDKSNYGRFWAKLMIAGIRTPGSESANFDVQRDSLRSSFIIM